MDFLSKNYVKYGMIMASIVVLCLSLMEVTGQNQSFEKSPFIFFSTAIAPALIWYLGLKAKKKLQNGKLTFKQGLLEGFKISLTFAIVSPFIFLFYYLLVNPAIIPTVREVYHLTDASIAMVIGVDMLVQFISAVVFGTMYAAVIALIVRSKPHKK